MIAGATKIGLQVDGLSFTAWDIGQGPLVLCLHGFPDTPLTYRHLLPSLAQAGYRAVAVCMRGYEPSSQPADGDYSMAALAHDVGGWLDALAVKRVHLIGHDWGAVAGYAAAALLPRRVLSLTMMSVPQPAVFAAIGLKSWKQMRRCWYMAFFQLPGLSDYALQRNDWALVKTFWRHWSPQWDAPSDQFDDVRAHFIRPGVKTAALAYYRTAFARRGARSAETDALFSRPIVAPTLGLTGARDGCIGPEIFAGCMPARFFAGGVAVHTVAETGHFLHLEKPAEVNALILAHLAKTSVRTKPQGAAP